MFNHSEMWNGIDRLANAFGYSPSGLAKKAGLDPTSFNKSKRISPDGKPRWPSTESLSKVLNVTGSTMSDFFALMQPEDNAMTGLPTTPLSDARRKEIAHHSAKILLDIKAVLFNAEEPFTLTSGNKSPVYVDCRRPISFAAERGILMDYAAEMLTADIGVDALDILAGGETAGIPYSAFIAERLEKPMVYVRKKPKGHGAMSQIEGDFDSSSKPNVVLVEDLQNYGTSQKVFVDALRDTGARVDHSFVVFNYDIHATQRQALVEQNITLHYLTTWRDVMDVAREHAYLDDATIEAVESFLDDPVSWQEAYS